MGALKSIGIIDTVGSQDQIATTPRTLFKDATVQSIENGFSIGSFQVPAIQVSLGRFSSEVGQQHVDAFPAWNGMYVTGLLQNVALALDLIPDAGILKPIGIFDPTKPVLIVINNLRSLFDQIFSTLPVSIDAVLLLHLDVVLAKSGAIISALDDVIGALGGGARAATDASGSFIDVLKITVRDVLRADNIGESVINNVIRQINDADDQIRQAIVEAAREISTSIALPLPSFPIPDLDISFMQPGVNVAPLFSTLEANQVDGIATKFIKLMTVFASLPAEIVEQIQNSVDLGDQLKSSLRKLITNVAEGSRELLDTLLGLVWGIVTSVIGISSSAALEAASIYQLVTFFVKYFIISMVSFLLGSGLIALSVATLLEVV